MLLRIKDGVKLSRLKKYGFTLETDYYSGEKYYIYDEVDCEGMDLKLIVKVDLHDEEKYNRTLFLFARNDDESVEYNHDILVPLFDMIKDGIIEKVD